MVLAVRLVGVCMMAPRTFLVQGSVEAIGLEL